MEKKKKQKKSYQKPTLKKHTQALKVTLGS